MHNRYVMYFSQGLCELGQKSPWLGTEIKYLQLSMGALYFPMSQALLVWLHIHKALPPFHPRVLKSDILQGPTQIVSGRSRV